MDTPTVNGKSQVSTQITVSCGCGARLATLAEAKWHSERTGHVLTIQGRMGPVERLVRMEVVR